MGSGFPIKASSLWLKARCMVVLARNLFHCMAESLGRLFASHESEQGSHAECGCERAFVFIFPLSLSLSRIFRCSQQTLAVQHSGFSYFNF